MLGGMHETMWSRAFSLAAICVLAFPGCRFSAHTDSLPELAFLAAVRTLSSSRFSYSGTNLTWSSGLCGTADQSTGVGPYSFFVDSYNDNVLITASSNIVITNPVCDGNNDSQYSIYVDGIKRKTLQYDRCWGQVFPMTGAFVIPLGLGVHSMELKFCANSFGAPTRIPQIQGAYPTVLTATSLESSPNHLGNASSVLPVGTTNLANTGSPIPIVNGSNMTATVTPAEPAILWQSLSLGEGPAGANFNLSSIGTEVWFVADDGSIPGTISTSTSVSAGANSVTALQQSAGTTIVNRSTYDSSLNVVAFKVPPSGTYGKAAITSTVNEAAGILTTLMSVPITRPAASRYLVSFAGNDVYSTGAGHGCRVARHGA